MLHHQPGTEPASCVCAHLGTVHVCSRRRGLARNHSWACRAFANRLAGIWEQEWEERGKGKSTEKKFWKGRRKEAGSRKLRGREEAFWEWERRCGIKFLHGNYPKHSVHRSSSCSAMSDKRCRNIRTRERQLSQLLLLPCPWALRWAALASGFSFAPAYTQKQTSLMLTDSLNTVQENVQGNLLEINIRWDFQKSKVSFAPILFCQENTHMS